MIPQLFCDLRKVVQTNILIPVSNNAFNIQQNNFLCLNDQTFESTKSSVERKPEYYNNVTSPLRRMISPVFNSASIIQTNTAGLSRV